MVGVLDFEVPSEGLNVNLTHWVVRIEIYRKKSRSYLTDTAMLISELTRFDSFYIFFHGTPRVFTM